MENRVTQDSADTFQNRFERALDLHRVRPDDTDRNDASARQPRAVSAGLLYPKLSHDIVGAAIEVHRHIGPGQLESVYQTTMVHELGLRGIAHRTQVPVELLYKGLFVTTFRLDLVVDDRVVVELKAVDRFHPEHRAQVISYLRATGIRLGLLINFNAPLIHRAVIRVVL